MHFVLTPALVLHREEQGRARRDGAHPSISMPSKPNWMQCRQTHLVSCWRLANWSVKDTSTPWMDTVVLAMQV
jgi:hypothetical protein